MPVSTVLRAHRKCRPASSLLVIYLAVLPLIVSAESSSGGRPPLGSSETFREVAAPGSVPQAVDIVEAAPPKHLKYPRAAIDIQVHPLDPDEQAVATRSLIPPRTPDGYWLVPFGSPGAGSTNTTYIVGHSWVGQDAPFNRLSNAAAPGDRLTVLTATGSVDYQVDTVTAHSKLTLRNSDIWNVVPNRLVLISCHTDDPWGTNIVVVASPVGARPASKP